MYFMIIMKNVIFLKFLLTKWIVSENTKYLLIKMSATYNQINNV